MAVSQSYALVLKEQEKHINELRASIEDRLQTFLGSLDITADFKKAIHYALVPGGKRIRPLLSLLTYEDLGGDPEEYLSIALALEFLHCASLVHDDLPALDDDDLRRGRPSLHKSYGEATAVLVGDAMPAIIGALVDQTAYDEKRKYQLLSHLLQAQCGLCEGQFLDLDTEHRRTSLLQVHRLKTGALFACSYAMSAIAAGVPEKPLYEFGISFGVYFQLVDDLLDKIAPKEGVGKRESSDDKNDRHTWFQEGSITSGLERLEGVEMQLDQRLERVLKSYPQVTSFAGIAWSIASLRERKEAAVSAWRQRSNL